MALSFRTAKEAINLANNTIYGLGASVWSESSALALEVATSIKAGTVWINCHNVFDAAAGFGGYKQSGYGRDGGKEVCFAIFNLLILQTLFKKMKLYTCTNKISFSCWFLLQGLYEYVQPAWMSKPHLPSLEVNMKTFGTAEFTHSMPGNEQIDFQQNETNKPW